MASADLRAARRYARALFQLALQRNEVDAVANGLAVVEQASEASPQLNVVLHHPKVSNPRKKELIRQIFGSEVSADVLSFFDLLIDKDRIAVLSEVPRLFSRMVDEHNHTADAEAVTAVPMQESQIEALKERLRATTGYSVRIKTRVDPSILGGLVVRVGDVLIDGSVTTQLQLMREHLRRAKVA